VVIEGRAIAKTFWGQAWCDNLERYSDFSNRLPRGRTYARNGSVVDLQIETGKVAALVSGSSLYTARVEIQRLATKRWGKVIGDCAGKIDSVVELLTGKLSKGVMEVLCAQPTGLFPSTKELTMSCSCPDGAWLCKHLAAVLYGVGARLDHEPELLFVLRGVDPMDLVAAAGKAERIGGAKAEGSLLGGENLSEIFGIELDATPASRRHPAGGKPKMKKSRPGRSRGRARAQP
jgi:uncharacterized Zn finger protein